MTWLAVTAVAGMYAVSLAGAEQGSVDRCTREVSIDDAAPRP